MSTAPALGQRPTALPRRGTGSRTSALLLAVVLVLGLVQVVRSSVATPVRISSSSMQPTLAPGDVVLVRRGVRLDDLSRGDQVLFRSPEDGRQALKRVVGLPGESVVVKDAVLHVDGRPVDEPYVDHALIDAYYSRTYTVPPATVFVLGDNRGNSVDSRDHGPVPVAALLGEAVVRLWPPVRLGGPRPGPPRP